MLFRSSLSFFVLFVMSDASELAHRVALAEEMLRKASADLEAMSPGLGALVVWQGEGLASSVKGKERERPQKKRRIGVVYSDDALDSESSVIEVAPPVIRKMSRSTVVASKPKPHHLGMCVLSVPIVSNFTD